MNRLLEAVVRLVVRLRSWLRAQPRFQQIYQRVSRETLNRRSFSPVPIHEWMLADHARVDAYYRAISRYVGPNETVIDLGAGSGILSFFAAQRKPKRLLAIDHADIIDVAQRVATANGLSNIEFIKTHSNKLSLPEKIDVIIHEQIGIYVFDEEMVTNITDLRDRLLKPSGRILPSRFEVYVEPVKVRDEYRVPFLWEQSIHGVNFAGLRPWYEQTVDRGKFMHIRPEHIDYLLCRPEKVMAFDLMTVRADALPTRIEYTRPVARAGRLDGFCLYFRASFDDEIVLGNSPGDTTTSWVMPLLRVPSRECRSGQTIELRLTMEELTAPAKWHWTCAVT